HPQRTHAAEGELACDRGYVVRPRRTFESVQDERDRSVLGELFRTLVEIDEVAVRKLDPLGPERARVVASELTPADCLGVCAPQPPGGDEGLGPIPGERVRSGPPGRPDGITRAHAAAASGGRPTFSSASFAVRLPSSTSTSASRSAPTRKKRITARIAFRLESVIAIVSAK